MNAQEKIDSISMTAERIMERPGTDFKEAVHWKLTLNSRITIEYSEGIGHFINIQHRLWNKLITENIKKDFLKGNKIQIIQFGGGGLTLKEYRELFTSRLDWKTGHITPPAVKDVLFSLTQDADAINYTFENWCSNYGYDSDSRKAEGTYKACIENFQKIRALGFALEDLQEFFQDY